MIGGDLRVVSFASIILSATGRMRSLESQGKKMRLGCLKDLLEIERSQQVCPSGNNSRIVRLC